MPSNSRCTQIACIITLFLALSLLTGQLHADSADSIDDQMTREHWNTFHEVEANILSPFCPGRLLKDCPSTAARDLKLSIKEQILKGETAQGVQSSLIDEYGNELKSSPDHSGIGLLAWYAPAGFLLLGFIGLVFFITRSKTLASD